MTFRRYHTSLAAHAIKTCMLICAFSLFSLAELPSELPGEEVTQDYLNWAVPNDTAKQKNDTFNVYGMPAWLNKAMKTWEAPSLSEQQSSDMSNIPMGKGAVFIPKMTTKRSEPDIEIFDPEGRSMAAGKPGKTYALEPGNYYVMLGSGAHRQRLVRKIEIEEGRTTPVVPDWAGLSIEVVDEHTNPFRGEYELARIDEFTPYGRGYGANPDIGEAIKTWILKPGIYKIFKVGEGFNTLNNFVTVRLLPGELVRFMLIQDPKDLSVKGGGTVDITQRTELASHWKYRADIGGNIKFNANIDSKAEKNGNTYSTIVSLLSNALLDYENDPFEWENKILVDEGFNFSGLQVADLATDVDEFRFSSLFIWRFLPWFGPYGRTEVITNFLPRRINRGDNYKYFCILDSSYYVKSREGFDSSMTFQLNPSFSPLTFDIGFGANADLIGTNIFESKLRIGFGSSFSSYPDRFNEVLQDKALWRTPQDSLLYESFLQKSRTVLPQSRASIIEIGPQTALNMMLRIGWFATATAELNIFAPIAPELRFMRPDFDLTTTLSWQLSHWVTLDYKYSYMLKQPSDPNLQVDRQSHGVTLRLQFTSR